MSTNSRTANFNSFKPFTTKIRFNSIIFYKCIRLLFFLVFTKNWERKKSFFCGRPHTNRTTNFKWIKKKSVVCVVKAIGNDAFEDGFPHDKKCAKSLFGSVALVRASAAPCVAAIKEERYMTSLSFQNLNKKCSFRID